MFRSVRSVSGISNREETTQYFPPDVHILGYVTGGLGSLFRCIERHKKVIKHVCGAFTGSDGICRPFPDMPLLASRYRFIEVIGQAQSSIVIKAQDTFNCDRLVAIKVLHRSYSDLGHQEANCLKRLNCSDVVGFAPVLRLYTTFKFDGHYCLVFELLNPAPLTHHFKYVSSETEKLIAIRKVTARLLFAVGFLHQHNIIHADIKPANVLLQKTGHLDSLKLVDFGNSIHSFHEEVSLYYDDFELQTLLYRAPEVMFGMMFGVKIDMWSIGCVLAELFIGRPLFDGDNKQTLIAMTVDLLGPFPQQLYQCGKYYSTLSRFCSNSVQSKVQITLMRRLRCRDFTFVDFLARLLKYDPAERMSVNEAANHEFLAPELGLKFVHPISHQRAGYRSVMLSAQTYPHQPYCSDTCRKAHRCNRPSESSSAPQGKQNNISELEELEFLHRPIIVMPSDKSRTSTLHAHNNINAEMTGNTRGQTAMVDSLRSVQAFGRVASTVVSHSAKTAAQKAGYGTLGKQLVLRDVNIQQRLTIREMEDPDEKPNCITVESDTVEINKVNLGGKRSVTVCAFSTDECNRTDKQPDFVSVYKFDDIASETKQDKPISNLRAAGVPNKRRKREKPVLEMDSSYQRADSITKSRVCGNLVNEQRRFETKNVRKEESKCNSTFNIVDPSDIPMRVNDLKYSEASRCKIDDARTTDLSSDPRVMSSTKGSSSSSTTFTCASDVFKRRGLSNISVDRSSSSSISTASSPCSNANIKRKMDELKRKQSAKKCASDADESCRTSCRRELFQLSSSNEMFVMKTEEAVQRGSTNTVVDLQMIKPSSLYVPMLSASSLSHSRSLRSDSLDERLTCTRAPIRGNRHFPGNQRSSILDETFVFATHRPGDNLESCSVPIKNNETFSEVLSSPDLDTHNFLQLSDDDDSSDASITSGPSGRNIKDQFRRSSESSERNSSMESVDVDAYDVILLPSIQ